jgi:predicted RNA binding protein YcfA (HicA-like mRNA interferase family)
MKGYYKLVIEQLRLHGFTLFKHGKGSHEIWEKGSVHVTVPFNCESRHTANAIMKACGINHKF